MATSLAFAFRMLSRVVALVVLVLPLTSLACQSINILSPANNAIYGAPATFNVNVQVVTGTSTDADGTPINRKLRTIQLFKDGVLYASQSYANVTGTIATTFVVSGVAAGSSGYYARATCLPGSAQTPTYAWHSNLVPDVSLSAPTNGHVIASGGPATVVLAANASDTGGSVARVEFRSGSILIGTANSPPFTVNWSGLSAGIYSFNATAVDNLGTSTTTSSSSFRVNALPSVSMTASSTTAVTPPGNFVLTASASDADGTINRIEFYNGTTLLGTDTSAPYAFSWTGVSPGTYSVYARAFDNDGVAKDSAAVSLVVNALPSVAVSAPAAGAVINGSGVQLAATASDGDGSIQRVEYYNGANLIGSSTSAPYTVEWTNLGVGTHSVFARAIDNRGGVANSSALSFRINAVPTISISSPPNNAVALTAPGSFSLAVNTADADGVVSQVQYFSGATLIGTATGAPWTVAWNNVAAGTYLITAKARDNDGGLVTSEPINVRVNTAPKNVSVSVPALAYAAPASFTLSAMATDVDGIQRLEFFKNGALLGSDTQAPYQWDVSDLAAGNYSFHVVAYDSDGASTASSAVSVRISAVPTVAISSPPSGLMLSIGDSVTITGVASDSDGSIARVDVYDGASLLGQATVAGGSYVYAWSSPPAGSHVITMVATDDAGVASTSAAVAIAVAGETPIVAPNLAGSGVAGSLPGLPGVSSSGASTYGIPIAVPPGTTGLVPTIALQYSSQAGPGLLGLGWSIAGTSAITRCGKTRAQDGVSLGVTLTADDQFCLDGARLILVSGTHGQNAEYRTEVDSFSRVLSFGSDAAKGPDRWEVWTKGGPVMHFGTTGDSLIEAQGRTTSPVILTWALAKAQDRRGNYFTIAYGKDSDQGAYWPLQMSYTGNGVMAPYNAVRFEYDNRLDADRIEAYVAGSKLSIIKRLRSVRTYVNIAGDGTGGTLVRDFRIAYTSSTTSGRSLVASVSDCDGSGNCLPPTTFNWSQRTASDNNFDAPGGGDWGGPAATIDPSYGTPSQIAQDIISQVASDVLMGDFNGDGKTDMVSSVGQGAWRMCLSIGTGFDCADWNGPAKESAFAYTGDFDGDGVTDIAVPPELMTGPANWQVCLSTGAAFNCGSWAGYMLGANREQYMVGDFDGDGRDDIVMGATGMAEKRCISTGSAVNGFVCTDYAGVAAAITVNTTDPLLEEVPRYALPNAMDVNGDGRADVLKLSSLGSFTQIGLYAATDTGFSHLSMIGNSISGTNGAWSNTQFPTTGGSWFADHTADPYQSYPDWIIAYPVPSVPSISAVRYCQYKGQGINCLSLPITSSSADDFRNETFSDVDGDGRPDGVHWNATRGQWRVCQVNGAATSYDCADWGNSANPADYTAHYFGDFNGDGKVDIALYNRDTGRWTVKLANGPKPDLLVSVKNGIGLESRFAYKPLTDSAVYTKDAGATAASFPDRDVQPSAHVVSQQRTANALGGWLDTDYAYGGLKINMEGRGQLGFRWTRTTDAVSGIQSYDVYSQVFPTIGFKTLAVQASRTGVELQRISSAYARRTTASARIVFPFETSVTEVRNDLNGTAMTTAIVQIDPVSGYDAYGNLLAKLESISANGDTFTTSTINTYDNAAATWLIGQKRSSSVTKTAPGASAVTRVTTWDYDAYGQQWRETLEPNTPALALISEIGRDSVFGNVTTRTLKWIDPRTASTKTRVVETSVFDTKGRFATTIKNALNQSETRVFSELHGGMTSLTGPNLVTTTWAYDAWGRRTKETRADGTSTTWAYRPCVSDCNGGAMALVTQHWAGAAQIAVPQEDVIDSLGRLVRTRTWGFDGSEILADRMYDSGGRLHGVSRPYFANAMPAWSYLDYDEVGRRVNVDEPNETGGVWTTSIGYNGMAVTITNAKGQTRIERRNALGKIDRVTDAAAETTSYAFDPWGNLKSTTDPRGNQIRVIYDTLGRKTQLRDPDLGTWNYSIDPLGQTWRQVDAKAQATEFWFDDLGRTVQRLAPDQDARFVYDIATKGVGQLAEAYTLTGAGTKDYRRVYAYDGIGRLVSTTTTLDQDYLHRFAYGADGRVASERHERNGVGSSGGPGVTVHYAYNSLGYLAQIRSDRGNATVLDWTVQGQDAEHRVTQERLGNGLIARRVFSPHSGRMANISVGVSATDSAVQNDVYEYDPIGNLDTRMQRIATGAPQLAESFVYDSLNRLTGAQVYGQAAQTASYDVLGNLVSKSGAGTYSYPTNGADSIRPHALASLAGTVNGVSNPNFIYDANGNLSAGAGRTLTWTSFNAPKSIATTRGAASVTSEFVYGPEQQRTRQVITENGVTSTLWYAGSIEKETAGGTTKVRTYLPRGLGFIEDADGVIVTRYFHKDHLGSVHAITTETGAVLVRLSYDAWGQRRNADGSADAAGALRNPVDPSGYTGHEHLQAQGLIHMNGRVYDPFLGRFMSADPTVPDIGNPQHLNRYSYVLNNPFGYTDPSGFTPESLGGGWREIFVTRGDFGYRPSMAQEIDLPRQVITARRCGDLCRENTELIVGALSSAAYLRTAEVINVAWAWATSPMGRRVLLQLGSRALGAAVPVVGLCVLAYTVYSVAESVANNTSGAADADQGQTGEDAVGADTKGTPDGPDGDEDSKRGVGGKGWRGDKNWRNAVDQVSRAKNDTFEEFNGKVPTREEAQSLIRDARGSIDRIEEGHFGPNDTHRYPHINYTTEAGFKGTIRITGL